MGCSSGACTLCLLVALQHVLLGCNKPWAGCALLITVCNTRCALLVAGRGIGEVARHFCNARLCYAGIYLICCLTACHLRLTAWLDLFSVAGCIVFWNPSVCTVA